MFIPVGEAQIFTVSFGSKEASTILGVGGWIGSWELWTQPFSILSEHWRTIAFDHRGSGATVAPVETITFETLVDDIFTILDAYGVERSFLAAESMGVAVALGAALKHPERIAGLILVDGVYYQDGAESENLFLMGLQAQYGQTLDWFVQACVPEPDCDHIRRWGRQILDRASQDAAIELIHVTHQVNLREDIHRIIQPTLVIHGDADVIASLDDAQWLAKTLPNARLVVIKGAGHVPTMTYPLDVANEIANFLEACS